MLTIKHVPSSALLLVSLIAIVCARRGRQTATTTDADVTPLQGDQVSDDNWKQQLGSRSIVIIDCYDSWLTAILFTIFQNEMLHGAPDYLVERVDAAPLSNLGEGPHWDIERQSLYYNDIYGGKLLRYDLQENRTYSCTIGKVSIVIVVCFLLEMFFSAFNRRHYYRFIEMVSNWKSSI